jgi:adenylate cyclase
MTVTRRLVAILAADVAGYSRLIGADEEGTLNRLRTIRAEVVDPLITQHRGRIVKTTGDGLLVEFVSVVDALHCATEWQRGMAERNTAEPRDARVDFRIGVHQGDIVVEGDDIFGDGVNIAARSKVWPSPVVSAFQPEFRRTRLVDLISPSMIWVTRALRTLIAPCEFTESALML